jgi:hypothetical protein
MASLKSAKLTLGKLPWGSVKKLASPFRPYVQAHVDIGRFFFTGRFVKNGEVIPVKTWVKQTLKDMKTGYFYSVAGISLAAGLYGSYEFTLNRGSYDDAVFGFFFFGFMFGLFIGIPHPLLIAPSMIYA